MQSDRNLGYRQTLGHGPIQISLSFVFFKILTQINSRRWLWGNFILRCWTKPIIRQRFLPRCM